MPLDFNALNALANQAILPIKMINPEFERKRRVADALQSRIACNRDVFAYICADGSVELLGKSNSKLMKAQRWEYVKALSLGERHIVGLLCDSTVVAEGKSDKLYNACKVEDLESVDAICCSYRKTFFLKKGVMSDTNGETMYDKTYADMEGIAQMACSNFRESALLNNGTIYMAKNIADSYRGKVIDVAQWDGVVQIARSDEHIMCLRSNGTVLVAGSKEKIYDHFDACEWENIVSIACENFSAIGLRADGTVATLSYKKETSNWRNILAVGCAGQYMYGVRSDGAILIAGYQPPCRTFMPNKKIFENVDTILEDFLAQEEENAKKLQIMKQRQTQGLCRHCGGTLRGVIGKSCTVCGKKKDYYR